MANVYEMVTQKIIEQLEKGIIPWKKSWCNAGGAYNIVTKKPYSLINQLALFDNGAYGTFKQWSEMGGKIKKNAKAQIIIFWKIYEKKDDDGEIVTLPVLRYFNVFHQSQVEGIEVEKLVSLPSKENDRIEKAEMIKRKYIEKDGVELVETFSNKAFYSPAFHLINIPKIDQFEDVRKYYATFFHEAVHSTSKHLKRELGTSFGSTLYSKEELVAELGSSMILSELGIETESTIKNAAAYIQSWIKYLRGDSKLIVQAASKAEKASKYILEEEIEEIEEEDELLEEGII